MTATAQGDGVVLASSASMTAFVLLVLSSVLYDGLLTTLEWANAEQQLVGHGIASRISARA